MIILLQVALVYGQMNEPPGARARVALTGLTVAEYFRDQEGQDVLLFIDNIFRFTQAGSEVSPLEWFFKYKVLENHYNRVTKSYLKGFSLILVLKMCLQRHKNFIVKLMTFFFLIKYKYTSQL
jgi:hypothetical protein